MADRHAAVDELVLRQLEMALQALAQLAPRFLEAGRESALGGNQRARLHEHAQMRPLAVAHPLVDDEEQRRRRIEELIVSRHLTYPRGFVLARNAEHAVERLADL